MLKSGLFLRWDLTCLFWQKLKPKMTILKVIFRYFHILKIFEIFEIWILIWNFLKNHDGPEMMFQRWIQIPIPIKNNIFSSRMKFMKSQVAVIGPWICILSFLVFSRFLSFDLKFLKPIGYTGSINCALNRYCLKQTLVVDWPVVYPIWYYIKSEYDVTWHCTNLNHTWSILIGSFWTLSSTVTWFFEGHLRSNILFVKIVVVIFGLEYGALCCSFGPLASGQPTPILLTSATTFCVVAVLTNQKGLWYGLRLKS